MTDQFIQWGWNPNLNVPLALDRLKGRPTQPQFALIAMVDSTDEIVGLPSLSSILDRSDMSWKALDQFVVIEYPVLNSLVSEHHFFAGFDEVWLFAAPPTEGKPATERLTSDVRITSEPSAELSAWFQRNGGIAGLGDGDGLNWVVSDTSLAALLQR